MTAQDFFFKGTLTDTDPKISWLCAVEAERQMRKLVMIASESLCPEPVREALASEFVNIYAEGYPSTRMSEWERDRLDDHSRALSFFKRYGDRRYYKGTELCDIVESLAQTRCAELFANERVPAHSIYPNVQPLSGAAANNAVYEAFTEPGDTVMGMALPTGGHLTHGSEFNRSGKIYRIVSYSVNPKTGRLDYDQIADTARRERPKMIIVGYSAYPWTVDWQAFREIADSVGAVLFADIAHPAGLVAGGVYPSPVGWADVVSFTTHKTLCGPRGAVVLTTDKEQAAKVDMGVFPGEQGGPHLHTIAGKAVAFKLALTDTFRELQAQVVKNAKALAAGFEKRGLPLAYGGTDTHLVLLDCKKAKTAGKGPLYADVASRILDLAGITLNKNTIMGDEAALQPSGLRFGTTIVSQRGLREDDMDRIAEIVTDLIGSMKPYLVQGQSTMLGRAKVSLDAFLKSRAAVAALDEKGASMAVQNIGKYPYFVAVPEKEKIEDNPLADAHEKKGAAIEVRGGRRVVTHFGDAEAEKKAAAEGCIAVDGGDFGHFVVRGERATALLHAAISVDAFELQPGEGREGFLLDDDGMVLDAAVILRLENGEFNDPQFLLRTSGDAAARAAEWLRALSDGYVEFGAADLYAKVEGPAGIDEAGYTSFTVAGPKAADVLKAADPAAKGAVLFDRVGDMTEVFAPVEEAGAIWAGLVESGATPGGAKTRENLGGWAPKPGTGLAEALRGAPEQAFSAAKTFFVGMGVQNDLPKGEPLPPFEYCHEELPLRRTPIYEDHLKLTKKRNIIPFAGWEMPVIYTSISDEHKAVRERAGLFDVAHMGVFEVSGENAARFLDLVTTNYVPRLTVGESHYSYLLDPEGNCLDDLMIYRVAPQRFMVVVNAANAEKDWAWLQAYNEGKTLIDPDRPWARIENPAVIRDLKDPSSGADQRVDLALQGPRSIDTLMAMTEDRITIDKIRTLARNHNCRVELAGIDLIVSRTGYTGEEYGYEIYVHPDQAAALWRGILEAGRPFGVQPTGLGARDSTRTEAGLPLYGHDLAGPYDVDPIEAGYGYFVKWHKPFFVGRNRLLARSLERKRQVVRFAAQGIGARMANLGDPVVNKSGKAVGYVTSSALCGEEQIGLALVDRKYTQVDAPLSVYCIPRSGRTPDESNKKELKPGDKVLLPLEGRIVKRFM